VKVEALRRYPVKSMLGEELTGVEVTRDGLAGDRGLALIHRTTGKVVSAKNPRLWRAMLKFTARGHPPDVTLTLPDGRAIPASSPGIDKLLSDVLNQPVTLVSTPPPGATLDRSRPEEVLRDGITAVTEADVVELPGGTFHDFAAIHLVTTATLAAIGTEPERYRPNIVIGVGSGDLRGSGGFPEAGFPEAGFPEAGFPEAGFPEAGFPEAGFPENGWLGRELRIGAEVIVRIVARTPRCAVPTLEHGTLARDTGALRVPAALNRVAPMDGMSVQPCAGVYAQVLRPGRLSLGDCVRL
jgi:uncharacterized protein YcbX